MEYIALARGLFERLKGAASESDPLETLGEVFGGSLPAAQDAYRSDLHGLLQTSLGRIGASGEGLGRVPQISFYERAIPGYTLLILFWIWQNRAPLADPEVETIVQAVYEGMLGYRLIDVYVDQHLVGPEAVVLGTYLIRSHESLLAGVFGAERSFPILRRYADLYASVEYMEKHARWKPCPFSWTEAKRLGLKAAPLFAVFHLIFAAAGREESRIEELVDGLCCTCAAIQMSDDRGDAVEDLRNGFETLAASGYFEWRGSLEVTDESVREFLSQRKTNSVVWTTLDLLNSASALFEKNEDIILSLFAQRNKNRFLRRGTAVAGSPQPRPAVQGAPAS